MRVKIKSYRFGGFELIPVSSAQLVKIHKDMRENGAKPIDCLNSVLVEQETVEMFLSNPDLKDMDEGYTITKNVDNDLIRSLFGYCDN